MMILTFSVFTYTIANEMFYKSVSPYIQIKINSYYSILKH